MPTDAAAAAAAAAAVRCRLWYCCALLAHARGGGRGHGLVLLNGYGWRLRDEVLVGSSGRKLALDRLVPITGTAHTVWLYVHLQTAVRV